MKNILFINEYIAILFEISISYTNVNKSLVEKLINIAIVNRIPTDRNRTEKFYENRCLFIFKQIHN